MVKVKSHNLSILLLLLIISCNSGFQGVFSLKDNSFKRSSFRKSSLGYSSLSDSSFRKSSFSDSSFKRNSSEIISSRENLLKGGLLEKSPVEASTVKNNVKKLGKSNILNLSEMGSVGVKLDVKLNKLLGTFGIPFNERQVIVYIQSILTDPSIGGSLGYKFYDNEEFYNLLSDLGDFRLKKIIEFHLKIIKAQNDAQVAIRDVKDTKLKERLQTRFKEYNNAYPLHLKGLFSKAISDNVYDKVIGSDYNFKFNTITDKARSIIDFESLYAELSGDQRIAVDNIRMIVTDPGIGSTKGYKTYSTDEFYNFLYSLDALKIKTLIKFHVENVIARNESLAAICDVKDAKLKKRLQTRFEECNNAYPLYLKELFNESTPDGVYGRVIKSKYASRFAEVKAVALGFIKSRSPYTGGYQVIKEL
ncbi:BTA121 domain-containing protein surface lipoprotein [Borrelia turicatae]|uniref:BTA121 domain-containing protein surface lipoprotein n=1 Tax=Borrelia turicatae TaxID=142 RepID=UPI002ED5CA4D